MDTSTLHANPGGQITPSQIVGRDDLIRRLWRILRRQSLVLSAERRIGKTSIMKKMIADGDSDADAIMVFHDLEKLRTRLELVETLFHDVEKHLSRSKRTAQRARSILSSLGGAELKGLIKFPTVAADHWKSLLTGVIEDLMEQDRPVYLFWDEFSLLLINIQQEEGASAATELLDVLRSLRQMHPKLRMILTGSVGILNIIGRFRREGYRNDPLNDMYTQVVPPLSPEAAADLASRLLVGEKIQVGDLDAASRAVASAVDDLPYYIHHVVDNLADRGEPYSDELLEEIIAKNLVDSVDPWHLEHYLERIPSYYDEAEQPFAYGLLDTLATAEEPLEFEDLWNGLKSNLVTEDSGFARRVLRQLQHDHYIVQETDGTYRFVFPLIQRWWRLQRC